MHAIGASIFHFSPKTGQKTEFTPTEPEIELPAGNESIHNATIDLQ